MLSGDSGSGSNTSHLSIESSSPCSYSRIPYECLPNAENSLMQLKFFYLHISTLRHKNIWEPDFQKATMGDVIVFSLLSYTLFSATLFLSPSPSNLSHDPHTPNLLRRPCNFFPFWIDPCIFVLVYSLLCRLSGAYNCRFVFIWFL